MIQTDIHEINTLHSGAGVVELDSNMSKINQ